MDRLKIDIFRIKANVYFSGNKPNIEMGFIWLMKFIQEIEKMQKDELFIEGWGITEKGLTELVENLAKIKDIIFRYKTMQEDSRSTLCHLLPMMDVFYITIPLQIKIDLIKITKAQVVDAMGVAVERIAI